MNCKQYRTVIDESDFAAGHEAARSGSHADGCAECRAYGDKTAAVRGLVAGLARVDAPADFEFRLRARLNAAETARPRAWSPNLLPRAAWLGAAGCLALAAALALQTRDPRPADPAATFAPPPAAQTAAQTAVNIDANTVANANSGGATRGESAEKIDEVPEVKLTASPAESDGSFVARRKERAAPVAAASAARSSQRRHASAASALPFVEAVAASAASAGRTETNTMAMTGSPVIVTSAIPLPISADERPLQVLFKDTQGASRVVNVDPVAFGSNDPAARPSNVTFTKAAKKQGVW